MNPRETVRSLAYVGVQTARLDSWIELAQDLLGITPSPAPSGDALHLRIDEQTYRLSLHRGPTEEVLHVGWEVTDDVAFESVHKRLLEAGVAVNEGDDDEARERCVGGFLWFQDPGGMRVEVCHGHARNYQLNPRDFAGRLAGPSAMAHIAILTEALESTANLYRAALGFRVSDYRTDGVYFLRCNRRHHSVALALADRTQLFHISFEYPEIDDVGLRWDIARRMGCEVKGLGRHSIDGVISFYLETPSGFRLEIGTPGIKVDEEEWVAHQFLSGDVWGHRPTDRGGGA